MRIVHRAVVDLMQSAETALPCYEICRIEPVNGSDTRIEIWYCTDENAPTRKFRVIGTGHPYTASEYWVASAARTVGGAVWHLVASSDGVRFPAQAVSGG